MLKLNAIARLQSGKKNIYLCSKRSMCFILSKAENLSSLVKILIVYIQDSVVLCSGKKSELMKMWFYVKSSMSKEPGYSQHTTESYTNNFIRCQNVHACGKIEILCRKWQGSFLSLASPFQLLEL